MLGYVCTESLMSESHWVGLIGTLPIRISTSPGFVPTTCHNYKSRDSEGGGVWLSATGEEQGKLDNKFQNVHGRHMGHPLSAHKPKGRVPEPEMRGIPLAKAHAK
ncbi:MAG: hypothetical protein U1G05_14280 [Kiritimatiellia bacterium]